jgi:ribose transport system substrate-binding protein
MGLLLLATLALPGCDAARVTPVSPPPARAGSPRIALIMKSLANEFFSTMADGAKRHQSEHADQYELIVNGIKDELDVARQVALVEEMVAQEVDAIVIAPADSKILVPVCKRAQAAGVVVINIDNKLDDGVLAENQVRIPFVGPDNRAGARLAGEHLAKRLQRGDKVAILEGVRTAFNGQQRLLGFQDAMKAAGMEIVDSQSALWEMDMANKVASAMLSEHPDLKALLCSNDSMALGALAASKAAGRTGTVAIIGYDGISAVQAAIKDGSIVATIQQHADQLAVFGIEYALQVLQGAATPEDKQTPVELITAETLK